MNDDIVEAKGEIIERTLARAREEYAASSDFDRDFTRQDAAILNLQRACDAAIDIGNHLTRKMRLPPAPSAAETFRLMGRRGLLAPDLVASLVGMVGFRNVAVHDYRKLDLAIVRAIIERDGDDLIHLARDALQLLDRTGPASPDPSAA